MRTRYHIIRPILEPFESRSLLSAGLAGLPIAGAWASPAAAEVLPLDGTFRGHYRVNPPNPDVGANYVANGSGHVHGVGHASLTGNLHSIGFILEGQAQGDLLLAGSKGTLTLDLTGVEQHGGPAGLPGVFRFAVVGGTGKYSNVHDSGTATLVTIPAHAKADHRIPEHGRFTMVLTSAPIPA